MKRTLEALRDHKVLAEKNCVREIVCVGTAALREARNRDVFLGLVQKELNVSVNVITERDEAFYTYLS